MKKICLIVSGLANGGVETFIKTFYSNSFFENYDKTIITHNVPKRDVKDFFENIGFKIISVPAKRNNFIKNFFMIKKIFKKEKFDIVHSNMSKSNFIYLYIAKICNIKKRIAHSHISINTNSFFKKIIYSMIGYLNRNAATNCIACSTDALLFGFGKKVYKKDNCIIHNAIDLDKFSYNQKDREYIRKSLNIKSNEIVIGNIARFTYQKNQEYLLDIMTYLKKYGNYKLILIGEGELKQKIIDKIKKIGLKENVIILEPVADVYKYYSAFDLFCLPSRFEGLGIVGIESQANGLYTIVSSKVPKELCQTDYIKFIDIDENSISEWVNTILSINGRNDAKKLYDSCYNFKIEVNKLLKMYDKGEK